MLLDFYYFYMATRDSQRKKLTSPSFISLFLNPHTDLHSHTLSLSLSLSRTHILSLPLSYCSFPKSQLMNLKRTNCIFLNCLRFRADLFLFAATKTSFFGAKAFGPRALFPIAIWSPLDVALGSVKSVSNQTYRAKFYL